MKSSWVRTRPIGSHKTCNHLLLQIRFFSEFFCRRDSGFGVDELVRKTPELFPDTNGKVVAGMVEEKLSAEKNVIDLINPFISF